MKFDSDRKLFWSTFFGGGGIDDIFGVAHNSSQDIVIVGNTTSSTSVPLLPLGASGSYYDDDYASMADLLIGKFSNNGTQLYTSYFGGAGTEFGLGQIMVDESDNIYIIGGTESDELETLDSGGSYFQEDLNNNGSMGDDNSDAFVLSFNPDFVQSWTTFFGGWDDNDDLAYGELGLAIAKSPSGIFIAGKTQSHQGVPMVDYSVAIPLYNPGDGAYFQNSLSANGYYDAFITKFCAPEISSVKEIHETGTATFGYPIPAENQLTIVITGEEYSASDVNIKVFDTLGRIVRIYNFSNLISHNSFNLDLEGLVTGIYLADIEIEGKHQQIKFVKN